VSRSVTFLARGHLAFRRRAQDRSLSNDVTKSRGPSEAHSGGTEAVEANKEPTRHHACCALFPKGAHTAGMEIKTYVSTGTVICWPTWILFGSEMLLAAAMLE
jgi:hypothetical protein